MPLLRARNADITDGRQETFVTASVASGAGTLTVADISGFAVGNYAVLGKWGEESSEIVRVHASTAPSGTTITLAANTAYAHGIGTPLTFSPFNQVNFARATTATGTPSSLTTIAIQADELYTNYDDTTNSTGFGFIRFYNSSTTTYSSYSGAVPYSGYASNSLYQILKLGRTLTNEPTQDFVKDTELILYVNHKQRDLATSYKFLETIRSTSSVANQYEYTFASNLHIPRSVTYRTRPLAPIPLSRWEEMMIDSRNTSDDPLYVAFWGTQTFRIWPVSASAAQTTAINDAAGISATVTSVTVDSTSGFPAQGRIIIDSEVMTYTGTTTTTFTGLTRGVEGTTAATHADDATITDRDIIYSYWYKPDDLDDYTDTTDFGDAELFGFAIAEYIETKRGNTQRGTYFNALYSERVKQLKARYTTKQNYGFFGTRAAEDTIRDSGWIIDPNKWPHDLTGN